MSKKMQPRIAVGDHTGKQIATYRASLEAKDRVVASFTSWLKMKGGNNFCGVPTMTIGYGLTERV